MQLYLPDNDIPYYEDTILTSTPSTPKSNSKQINYQNNFGGGPSGYNSYNNYSNPNNRFMNNNNNYNNYNNYNGYNNYNNYNNNMNNMNNMNSMNNGYNRYNNYNNNLNNNGYNNYRINNNNNSSIKKYNKSAQISQNDFADKRRFHLKVEIIKDWVQNREYLMNANDLSARRIEEYMVKYNYKRIFDIIDVRCHDFTGGNIPNAYHCSFEEFDACMQQLLLTFQCHSDLIFHCMYSQHRGPKAAYAYWVKRREWEAEYPEKLHRVW